MRCTALRSKADTVHVKVCYFVSASLYRGHSLSAVVCVRRTSKQPILVCVYYSSKMYYDISMMPILADYLLAVASLNKGCEKQMTLNCPPYIGVWHSIPCFPMNL